MLANLPMLLSLPKVVDTIGLSRASIYRAISMGAFPKPVQLSARRVAWPAQAVVDWVAQRTITQK